MFSKKLLCCFAFFFTQHLCDLSGLGPLSVWMKSLLFIPEMKKESLYLTVGERNNRPTTPFGGLTTAFYSRAKKLNFPFIMFVEA